MDLDKVFEDRFKLMRMLPYDKYDQTGYLNLKDANEDFYNIYKTFTSKISDSRKRAKKMGFAFDLDARYLCNLFFKQGGRCALTGMDLGFTSGTPEDKNPYAVSVDRINNNRGYVKGNVRLLVHWANNAKSTYTDNEFNTFITESFKHAKRSIV